MVEMPDTGEVKADDFTNPRNGFYRHSPKKTKQQ